MVLSATPIRHARGTFKGVNRKPSQAYLFSTILERRHLDQCMKECLFSEKCLTTVFDDELGACHQYNNFILNIELDIRQTAVVKINGEVTNAGKSK